MHPDIEAVYLTSPTFEGLVCDYDSVRRVCGDKMTIVVDEAHGTHLYFDSKNPKGAMLSGLVDLTINSTHKNMGGLAATALINVAHNSRISPDVVKDIYLMKHTTSVNVFMLCDMEGVLRIMQEEGDKRL